MIANSCTCSKFKKSGKDRRGQQRFKCLDCGRRWNGEYSKPIGDMRIDLDKATFAINLLLEGMSVRACERLTGLNRDTICDLILVVGENCERFLKCTVREVAATDIQVDELWSFVGMKDKVRVAKKASEEFGDSWTFIAVERNTKLILAHAVGKCDRQTTQTLLDSVKSAVVGRFQMTTDGFGTYTNGVPMTFGNQCDFAHWLRITNQARWKPAIRRPR